MATEYNTLVIDAQVRNANNVNRLRNNVRALRVEANGLNTALAGVGVAAAGASFIKLGDSAVNAQNRIRALGGSFRDVVAIANTTRTSLDAVAGLYSRIATNANNLGVSQRQVATITETVAKALAVGGASTQEAASAMLQLSQALGSGTLRGEEFNAVAEASPVLMQKLATTILGPNGTIGSLKKLASEGKLTSKTVSNALLILQSDIDNSFGKLTPTIGQSFTRIGNQLGLGIADSKTYKAISSIANAVANLGIAWDGVIDKLVIGAGVIAGASVVGRINTSFDKQIEKISLLKDRQDKLNRTYKNLKSASFANDLNKLVSVGKSFDYAKTVEKDDIKANRILVQKQNLVAKLNTQFAKQVDILKELAITSSNSNLLRRTEYFQTRFEEATETRGSYVGVAREVAGEVSKQTGLIDQELNRLNSRFVKFNYFLERLGRGISQFFGVAVLTVVIDTVITLYTEINTLDKVLNASKLALAQTGSEAADATKEFSDLVDGLTKNKQALGGLSKANVEYFTKALENIYVIDKTTEQLDLQTRALRANALATIANARAKLVDQNASIGDDGFAQQIGATLGIDSSLVKVNQARLRDAFNKKLSEGKIDLAKFDYKKFTADFLLVNNVGSAFFDGNLAKALEPTAQQLGLIALQNKILDTDENSIRNGRGFLKPDVSLGAGEEAKKGVKTLRDVESILKEVNDGYSSWKRGIDDTIYSLDLENLSLSENNKMTLSLQDAIKRGNYITQEELDIMTKVREIRNGQNSELRDLMRTQEDYVKSLRDQIIEQEKLSKDPDVSKDGQAEALKNISILQGTITKAEAEYQNAVRRTNGLWDERLLKEKESIKLQNDSLTKFAEFSNSAFGDLKNLGINTLTSGIDSLASAFANLAVTGKISFSSLAQSIAVNAATIVTKILLIEAITAGVRALFPGFASLSPAAANTGFSPGFLSTRASGRPVSGNNPYLVGENGPELFVPQSAGTIHRNGQGVGGNTYITNNNWKIDATDANSFRGLVGKEAEFIARTVNQGNQRISRRI